MPWDLEFKVCDASKSQSFCHRGSHFLQSPARRTPLSSLWAQRGICQSNGEHWIAWQSANQPLWTTFSANISIRFYMCFGSPLFCENIWEAVSWFTILQIILTWRKTVFFLWLFEVFPSVHKSDFKIILMVSWYSFYLSLHFMNTSNSVKPIFFIVFFRKEWCPM